MSFDLDCRLSERKKTDRYKASAIQWFLAAGFFAGGILLGVFCSCSGGF